MRVREGAALRRRRERLGLSQRELAFLARPCSQTTIHLLETRKMTTLTEGLAQRIARRLDVPLEDLFEDRTSLGATESAIGQRVTGKTPMTRRPRPLRSIDSPTRETPAAADLGGLP